MVAERWHKNCYGNTKVAVLAEWRQSDCSVHSIGYPKKAQGRLKHFQSFHSGTILPPLIIEQLLSNQLP